MTSMDCDPKEYPSGLRVSTMVRSYVEGFIENLSKLHIDCSYNLEEVNPRDWSLRRGALLGRGFFYLL